MKLTQEVFNRYLVIAITFAVGLVVGVLAVIAIQTFLLKNELERYDLAEIELQQDSPENFDRDSNALPSGDEYFEEIFKLPSSAEQYQALYNSLSQNTEQELEQWWIQSQSIERTSHREIAQQVILQNLTKINPQKALHYLLEVLPLQNDALSRTIFSEWAVLNLDEAIEAAAALAGARRSVALEAIIETRDDLSEDRRLAIAVQLERPATYYKLSNEMKALHSIANPSESWDILLNDNVDDSLQVGVLAQVAETWREQSGFEILSKIYHSGIEDYEIKNQLAAAISQNDPALALEYAQEVSDEQEQFFMSRIIVKEWAATDPLAALAAVSSFKPTSLYFELEEEVAVVWAKNKPYELIQGIELMSERARVWPLEVAFSYIAREDPLKAIESLSSVEASVGNTSTILHQIVDQWGIRHPEDATDWLLKDFDQEDPVLLHSLLEEVLPSLARKDPKKAFDIAIEQPTPNERFGLDLQIIWQLTRDGNVETAMSLLPRVRKDSKVFAYNNVGTALVNTGQTFEALELGSDLEQPEQDSYFRRVFQKWAETDPTNLYEALEDLPTSETQSFQSIAASELITRRFQRHQVLSDDQLKRMRSFLNSADKERVQMIERFENL